MRFGREIFEARRVDANAWKRGELAARDIGHRVAQLDAVDRQVALGERQRRDSGSASDLENAAARRELRVSDDVVDDRRRIAMSHRIVELGAGPERAFPFVVVVEVHTSNIGSRPRADVRSYRLESIRDGTKMPAMGKHAVWMVAVVAGIAVACGGRVTDGTDASSPPSKPKTNCDDPSLYDCGDGTCTDFVTDAKNCGGCGIDCGAGACVKGVCEAAGCNADGAKCSVDADCCTDFCATDGVRGCIPTGGKGCEMDMDCCSYSVSCDANGVCH